MTERTDHVGQQFGEYRLQRWLGGGGFGNVYLGEHVRDGTLAAVKVLQARLLQSQELKEFINEARTIRLVHPHIIRLLDFGIGANDIPFLVMEYAPNGTLRRRHPRYKRVPLATVSGYVTAVASALQYAHDSHLIHRDVKPENMLIGPEQEIWLSDFGLVAIAQSTRGSDASQGAGGTLPYMAPEQIHGKPRPASDQYALGIVVYEWLCGQRPFVGTTVELITQHTAAPPPLLRARVPDLPIEVEQVLFTALQKDPTRRFSSIQAFANAFEQACQLPDGSIDMYTQPTAPSEARVPITTEQSSPINTPFNTSSIVSSDSLSDIPPLLPEFFKTMPSQPSRSDEPSSSPLASDMSSSQPATPNASQLQLQVSAASSALSSSLSQPPPSPQPSIADISTAPAVKEAAHGWPFLSRRNILIAGLAGVAVAAGAGYLVWRETSAPSSEISNARHSSATQPAVIPTTNRLGRLAHVYRGHSDAVNEVRWAHSDGRIVSASADKTAQVWRIFNDNNVVIYRKHSGQVNAVDWATSGKYIVSGSSDQTAQVWEAMSGNTVFIYTQHTGAVLTVGWSPSKGRVASGGQDKTVRTWNFVTGNNTYIYTGHSDSVNKLAWAIDGKRIASCSDDHTVQIWEDLNSSGNVVTYRGHTDSVRTLAWSPDNKLIASAGSDQTVHIWDPVTGNTVYVYRKHSAAVTSVAWSPDGKYIVSGSEDHTVQIWQAINGNSVYTYPGHTGPVVSVAWSHNGKYIASGGDHTNPTVQIWNAL